MTKLKPNNVKFARSTGTTSVIVPPAPWSTLTKVVGTGVTEASGSGYFAAHGLAISADGNTMAASEWLSNKVFVYTRDGNTWTEQQIITGGTGGDRYGFRIAFSDDGGVMVVTSMYDLNGYGSANLYTRTGNTYTQQGGTIYASPNTQDQFGTSLALSGDGSTFVIGASLGASAGTGSGSLFVFTWDGSTVSQQAQLIPSTLTTSSGMGVGSCGISNDGNVVVIGTNSAPNNGYVFTRSGSTWSEEQVISSPDTPSRFGRYSAISGDGTKIAISDYVLSKVYTYSKVGGVWTLAQTLQGSDTISSDSFGTWVEFSNDGNYLLVGASQNDDPLSASGEAYLFSVAGNTYTEVMSFEGVSAADGDLTSEQIGIVCDISGDGSTVVLGSRGNVVRIYS